MTLGNRIASARKEAGLTQQGLADAVGRSVHAIRKWERDENEPSLQLLETVANISGVSVTYLIGREADEQLGEVEKTRAALERLQQRIAALLQASDLASEPPPTHPGVEALADSDLFRREYGVTDDELYMLRSCAIRRRDGVYVIIESMQGAVGLLEAIRRLGAG